MPIHIWICTLSNKWFIVLSFYLIVLIHIHISFIRTGNMNTVIIMYLYLIFCDSNI